MKNKVRNPITIKGLPNRMIRRILPKHVSDDDFAFSYIPAIKLLPTVDGRTEVDFGVMEEWNYKTFCSTEDLLARLAGLK